ncbi:MAG: preprotein translocase subunit SecY [Candidatus Bipolaricaulota bacterium]|jgi:preprotein translocase subunit SecY|nr:preprotein translocase subunit SecY [Candidatus Bipolaricaulota bacterium]
MWEKVSQLFRVPELRKRILFTLGAIIVFRLGTHIAVPGVNADALKNFFANQGGGIFDFLNMFTGGALQRFSLFALGVMPYINASIIFSLLTAVVPKLKEMQQQGREGRRKITAYTRWATLALAIIQAATMSMLIVNWGLTTGGAWFFVSSIVALTTGTLFLMWLGERMTENGIGNGISMLIMIGILSRFPAQLQSMISEISAGSVSVLWGLVFVVMLVVVVGAMTMVQQGQRKIMIQYAKRTSGRRIYGGHTSHLPIRVNQGGVIPIIFASALLTLPITLTQWLPSLEWIYPYIKEGGLAYILAYVILIFFFTYFYSSIVFDPEDVAKNVRESGGFIPGVRPGNPTAEYISAVLNRILLIGAVFLAAVAVLPYLLSAASGLTSMFFIGGTSLLIVVGVGVDTLMQIEAHLVMRHYESLTKAGGLLGRRR